VPVTTAAAAAARLVAAALRSGLWRPVGRLRRLPLGSLNLPRRPGLLWLLWLLALRGAAFMLALAALPLCVAGPTIALLATLLLARAALVLPPGVAVLVASAFAPLVASAFTAPVATAVATFVAALAAMTMLGTPVTAAPFARRGLTCRGREGRRCRGDFRLRLARQPTE